ncbi:hypothetical protein BO78DRAFT_388559 [Aspergillus sclerotiicarbonarius CBS 121057]|uniref:Uncharacterized protein n=1 Tax=Aspergillus sclerotiicarbonarius (strain CBS 121057 / IBT 28362) TaxID=1448318 RepID=A0A319E2X7_ASPSB|nr:hypothetical protein BO78DRAFT_388559 [Aspergillus sclerotiicarbonarius CBS 121057]
MEEYYRTQQALIRKTLEENAWLNALPISPADLETLRNVQGVYEVRHDDCPELGTHHRIWLIWDYDRLWGRFQFDPLQGMFLIDPGLDPTRWDAETGCSPPLPFEWMGSAAARLFEREELDSIASEIRINPRTKTLEGHFGFMWGEGWPGPGKMAFHATRLEQDDQHHSGYSTSLEDTVREWDSYLMHGDVRVRQSLSAEELEVELRGRDKACARVSENSHAEVDDESGF